MTTTIYIGTYSTRGSEGVYVCDLDAHDGTLTIRSTYPTRNPSFLAVRPDKTTLYVPEEAGGQGGVSALRIGADGALSLLNRKVVSGPCHLSVSPQGGHLVTSAYGDGSHSVLPILPDGSLGDVTCRVVNSGQTGPNEQRQEGPHAHSATFSADGGYVYCCDLGLDDVIVYAFDAMRGELNAHASTEMEAGAGPRHFALHPSLPGVAAVINELDNTITVFMRDMQNGVLTAMQTVSTLPPDAIELQHKGELGNSTADIHYSRDGRFLYGSNRGHNSIVTFAVDIENGQLDTPALAHVPTQGKTPRNFALVPNSDLMLVANQDTDTVVSYRVGGDGVPVATGAVLPVPAPVCVLPVA